MRSVSILLASWVPSAGDCVNPGLGREITPAVSTQNSRYRRAEEAIAGGKPVHERRTRSRTDPPFRDMWVTVIKSVRSNKELKTPQMYTENIAVWATIY